MLLVVLKSNSNNRCVHCSDLVRTKYVSRAEQKKMLLWVEWRDELCWMNSWRILANYVEWPISKEKWKDNGTILLWVFPFSWKSEQIIVEKANVGYRYQACSASNAELKSCLPVNLLQRYPPISSRRRRSPTFCLPKVANANISVSCLRSN